MKADIILEYEKQLPLFEEFGRSCEQLIKKLLVHNEFRFHQVLHRVKSVQSLTNKLEKDPLKYNRLDDITDIVGIRIVTYLESNVDPIAEMLSQEFDIDNLNSKVDERHNVDQFGYKSAHLVASINIKRCELSEYSKFDGKKVEIQVRSILQHAWAEIQHDLVYKSLDKLPYPINRGYSRLAALLEIADSEFDRLTYEIDKYKEGITKNIDSNQESIDYPINELTLDHFLEKDPVLLEIKDYFNSTLELEFNQPRDYSGILERFELFGIRSYSHLENSFRSDKVEFMRFTMNFLTRAFQTDLAYNIILVWYLHYLAAKTLDTTFIEKYISYGKIKFDSESRNFIDAYTRTIKDLGKFSK